MTVQELEAISYGGSYYNLQGMLWDHVMKRSEACFEKNAAARESISTKEELAAYAATMRENFIRRLGGIPYDSSLPLNAEITGVLEEPGLRIEHIVFQSRPQVYVTANLYLPEKRKVPCGAVLMQMGHSINGRFFHAYQKAARSMASAGLIVFAVDPMGQGERYSYFEPGSDNPTVGGSTTEHQYNGDRCVLLGDSIARYFISDAMRAVDYLLTRPEVDPDKIGATGCSGGGTATAHMMVCDPRIAAAAPVAFMTNRQQYLYTGGPQDSEQIWLNGTADGFDHHEVLACFAPKPVMLLTCDSDFFCIEGSDDLMRVCSRFWALHGKEGGLQRFSDDTTHGFSVPLAAKAGSFFAKVLNGEDRETDPKDVFSIPDEKLWATPRGQVMLTYPDAKTILEENQERWETVKCPTGAAAFVRERVDFARKRVPLRLRKILPVKEVEGLHVRPLMWFSQPQMPHQGLLFWTQETFDEIVICLWDKGTDELECHMETIREICCSGKAALVLDLSGMGKCAPYLIYDCSSRIFDTMDVLNKDLYFIGDSLCALRVYELEYALQEICAYFHSSGSVYAEGLCARYAQLLKLLHPEVDVRTTREGVTYEELLREKYYDYFRIGTTLIPGIGKYVI